MDKNKLNGSGCKDLTAYEALFNIDREECFKRLLATIFFITDLAGFSVEGRIMLRDKKTGKVWR